MILDRLESARRYEQVHPLFAKAFEILRSTDWSTRAVGTQVILPDRLSVIVSETTGRGREAARLETHKRFLDIQYVVQGLECIGWSHVTEAGAYSEPYSAEKDIAFHASRPQTWLELPAGHFAVFFPEDAHAPLAGAGPLRKVVVKVAMI